MSSQPLLPGDPDRLGEYTLEGRLGAGGMGTVFLGRTPPGRPVAVKVVRAELLSDTGFRGRFRSEVNRARQVPPFCTAEVLDADLDHEPPYLVVEYVDGPTLTDVVRGRGPLTPAALQSAAIGIATALTAIHGAGVIHRDLKPANVLFALGGLKVIDFGIARPVEVTSRHTGTDQMVGTVAYMAPERFDEQPGAPAGPAADIFAWGAVVAFAATGRTPFQGDSAPATAMRILTRDPDLTGVPAPLAGIVARALAKDPADRPTARELLDLLLATGPAAGSGPTPTPTGPGPAEPRLAGSGPAGSGPAGSGPAQSGPVGPRPAESGPEPAESGPVGPGPAESGPGPADSGRAESEPEPAGSGPVALTPSGAGEPPEASGPSPRRRSRVLLAALVVLGLLAGGGLAVRELRTTPDRNAVQGAGGDPAPAVPSSAATSPSPAGPSRPGPSRPGPSRPTPAGSAKPARPAAILAGERRTLIHFVEIDRDLAMPFPDEVVASGGTKPDALFALVPTGVDYLIQAAAPGESDPLCLGVKVHPDASATLVGAPCYAGKATLFSIDETGEQDEKRRPTYTIYNDAYGFIQWAEDTSKIYVEQVGDAPPDSTFSFVDRGAL